MPRVEKSRSGYTATSIIDASATFGNQYNSGVKSKATEAINKAVSKPAPGVAAPASKLTTEREKPPHTGKPPENDTAIFAAPKPTNS